MNKKEKGNIFENIAVEYLKESSYEIIRNNYRSPFGEIDIIAKEKDSLIFVEVKGSIDDKFKAFENINNKKILKIKKSAQYFLKENKYLNFENFRFDAIIITMEGNYFRVSHLKNI